MTTTALVPAHLLEAFLASSSTYLLPFTLLHHPCPGQLRQILPAESHHLPTPTYSIAPIFVIAIAVTEACDVLSSQRHHRSLGHRLHVQLIPNLGCH